MRYYFDSHHDVDTFHTSVAILDRYLSLDANHENGRWNYLVAAACFMLSAKLYDDLPFIAIEKMIESFGYRFRSYPNTYLGNFGVLPDINKFFELESNIYQALKFNLPVCSPQSVIELVTGKFAAGINPKLQKKLAIVASFLFDISLMEPNLCHFGMYMLAHGCSLVAYQYILDESMLPSGASLIPSNLELDDIKKCAAELNQWFLRSDCPRQCTSIQKLFVESFGEANLKSVVGFMIRYGRARNSGQF